MVMNLSIGSAVCACATVFLNGIAVCICACAVSRTDTAILLFSPQLHVYIGIASLVHIGRPKTEIYFQTHSIIVFIEINCIYGI